MKPIVHPETVAREPVASQEPLQTPRDWTLDAIDDGFAFKALQPADDMAISLELVAEGDRVEGAPEDADLHVAVPKAAVRAGRVVVGEFGRRSGFLC